LTQQLAATVEIFQMTDLFETRRQNINDQESAVFMPDFVPALSMTIKQLLQGLLVN